jgi:molecular chaperone GrpE
MQDGTSNEKRNEEESVSAQALAAENASLRDRMLRALADAENTRRRAERMAQDTSKYAVADFARELLAVADNLRRTITAAEQRAPERDGDAALLEGVRATERALMHGFGRFGVRKIDALGVPFDPTLHEAVIEVADESHPPGSVVQVLEDGFTIHDRLLRPARVAVAERRARPSSSSDDDDAAAGEGLQSSSSRRVM